MKNTGEYAELLGRESDTNAQIRTDGFHQVLDRISTLKLVSSQSAEWSQAEAFSKEPETYAAKATGTSPGSQRAMTQWPLEALAAVKSAGKKHIIITGFDGSPDVVAAIRAGELQGTSLQPAVLIARSAVDEAVRYLRTGSTGKPEKQIIPCDLVTRMNADELISISKRSGDSMANLRTIGVVLGNRDFFPDALITEARRDLSSIFRTAWCHTDLADIFRNQAWRCTKLERCS